MILVLVPLSKMQSRGDEHTAIGVTTTEITLLEVDHYRIDVLVVTKIQTVLQQVAPPAHGSSTSSALLALLIACFTRWAKSWILSISFQACRCDTP